MREAADTHVRPVWRGSVHARRSARDGYAASRVTELGVEAVHPGRRVQIDDGERPALSD